MKVTTRVGHKQGPLATLLQCSGLRIPSLVSAKKNLIRIFGSTVLRHHMSFECKLLLTGNLSLVSLIKGGIVILFRKTIVHILYAASVNVVATW